MACRANARVRAARRGGSGEGLLQRAGGGRAQIDAEAAVIGGPPIATSEVREVQVPTENARAVRYPVDSETLISRACVIAGREPSTARPSAPDRLPGTRPLAT